MRSLNFPLKFLLSLALLSIVVASCRRDEIDFDTNTKVAEFDASIPMEWNEVYLRVERHAAGYRPGPAPRSLALMGLAVYEACLPGMPEYKSLKNRYFGLNLPEAEKNAEYHWPTVVHAVYANIMPRFFPNVSVDLRDVMTTQTSRLNAELEAEIGRDLFDFSYNYGKSVADAMWEYASSDEFGHDAYLDPFKNYDWQAHYTGPGDWVPTVPGPPQPMFPHWGKVRTFAINEAQKLSRPPLPYSESPTSNFYSQALEVYAQNTPTLSFEGKWIGEFWSDDLLHLTFSPGPRWVAIANQAILKENSNLETAIEAYAKVGLALNDAAVACWFSKYYYNVERPETYIQRIIDPNWDSNLNNPIDGSVGVSPSFPAYPSGHATMGAAGAEALASVFGYSFSLADRCHEFRTDFEGDPRAFNSFYEMAVENGWSRVLLGVHFRMDSDEGVRFGTEIGRIVNRLPWKK